MLDYYSVSGCYILKPWSYSIWEIIQGMNICIYGTVASIANLSSRVVQYGDQEARRRECVLPYVRLLKSTRTRKEPHRRILSGGRLGDTSVRVTPLIAVDVYSSLKVVVAQISKNLSPSAQHQKLLCILVCVATIRHIRHSNG